MASPYNVKPGSSTGSRYNVKRRKPTATSFGPHGARPKKSSGKSIGGFLGNLASDVQDTIYGAPTAIKTVAEVLVSPDPKKHRKFYSDVAKSYTDTYGPTVSALKKGKFGKAASEFANALYDDGFYVAGDILTVASAGTAALAKAPVVGAKVATAGKATKLATGSGKTVEKALSSKPFRGNLERAARATGKAVIPPNVPVVGEYARAGKVIQRELQRPMETNLRKAVPAQRATAKLRGDEAVAAVLLRDLPLPQDLNRYVESLRAKGTREALATVALIEKPKVQKFYATPNKRVARAADELGKLSSENASMLGDMLGDTAKAQRPYLHTLLARGAKFDYDIEDLAKHGLTRTDVSLAPLGPDNIVGRWVNPADRGNLGKVVGFDRSTGQADVHFFNKAEGTEANVSFPLEALSPARRGLLTNSSGELVRLDDIAKQLEPPPGFASIDDAITGIKQELQAAGRPEPIFVPDTSDFQDVIADITPRGGGSAQAGANLLRSAQAQNLGVLFESGQRVLDPTVLVNKYLWNTKQAHYLDIHNELMKHADEITDGRVPEGWEIVRKPARPFATEVAGKEQIVGRSSQQIRYTTKKKGDYEKFLQQHLPADNPFTTTDVADAAVGPKGGILIVPRELARGVKGEFTRMSRFAYLMNKGPVKVWRSAVLNLRPAWLVNNVLGNSLMYAISNMDANGLRGLSEMFKRQYPKYAREFDSILDQHFARQRTATFIGTQRPSYSGRNVARRVLSKAVGSLADVDKWWEAGLRRSAVKAEMLRNPALRNTVKQMQTDTRDFWKAANEALDDNPVLVAQVENRVNDALGNFSALTGVEKNLLRTVFPFWAWYRAIVGVTLKLPLDQPVKYHLLTKLAPIGVEANLEEMGLSREDAPAFLRGFIPLRVDGDRVRGLSTSGVNPFATTLDMGKLVAALAMWQPGELGQALPGVNPFFMQVGEAAFGTDVRGGSVAGVPLGPLSPLYGVYQDFPQVKVAEAFGKNADPFSEPYLGTEDKPRLYDQDPVDLLLRFLGVPYARVSPKRAKQMVED